MSKRIFSLIALTILIVIMTGSAPAKEIIKLGTLVTEASDWGIAFKQMNAELVEKSDDNLQFQFYFARDEKELIDRIKNRQLDAVSMSIPGLGQIIREIFVFQLPMMFTSYEELDYVRSGLDQFFSQRFDEKGYILLGWGDLGKTYLFSKEKIKTQTDLRKTKVWVWDIDPISQAFAAASGQEPIRLPVGSVLSSLKKGDIHTIYGSPLACITYQWHTQVNYMNDLLLSTAVGATIMNKSRFDKFSDKHKRLLRETTMKYHEQLVLKIRERNDESFKILIEEFDIKVIAVPPQEKLKWSRIAGRVKNQFAGRFYEKELLDKVDELLGEFNKK